eukprot:scaffold169557_cov58-Attheya_sp.AAC.3
MLKVHATFLADLKNKWWYPWSTLSHTYGVPELLNFKTDDAVEVDYIHSRVYRTSPRTAKWNF